MKTKPGVGHLARWGLLVTAAIMSAVLLATSWAGYRSARKAARTVTLGQGEAILHTVREAVGRFRGPPSSQDLEAILEQQAAAGLRYLALVGPGGRTIVETGTPVGKPEDRRRGGGPPVPAVVDLGSRWRMSAALPAGRGSGPGDGPAARRPPGPGPGDRPRRPPGPTRDGRPPRPRPQPRVVIELEPLVADELAGHASRTLGSSALAAAALLLAAAIFWRLLRHREAAERRRAEQRQLAALGEMSAVLAHEIRNPVTSLKGHAQLLVERLPAGGRERSKAERIVAEAKRLEALSADLLDFCRTGPLDRRPVDPAQLLRDAAAAVGDGRLEVSADGAPASWSLDPLKMQQVLENVLRNACQASPEERPVAARVTADGDHLLFVVRDAGPGIPAGDEERIFAPFYTTRAQGTGLGLGVARRIVEMHGGTIAAGNRPAGGGAIRDQGLGGRTRNGLTGSSSPISVLRRMIRARVCSSTRRTSSGGR